MFKTAGDRLLVMMLILTCYPHQQLKRPNSAILRLKRQPSKWPLTTDISVPEPKVEVRPAWPLTIRVVVIHSLVSHMTVVRSMQPTSYRSSGTFSIATEEASESASSAPSTSSAEAPSSGEEGAEQTSSEDAAPIKKIPVGGVALPFNPFAGGAVPALKKRPAGAQALPGMGGGMPGIDLGAVKLKKRDATPEPAREQEKVQRGLSLNVIVCGYVRADRY